jgi:hypothetical protein
MPIANLIKSSEDVLLYSNRLYVEGDRSDKYKEKVDDNLGIELKNYFKLELNKYKTKEQYKATIAATLIEEDTSLDRGLERSLESNRSSKFKGFSN